MNDNPTPPNQSSPLPVPAVKKLPLGLVIAIVVVVVGGVGAGYLFSQTQGSVLSGKTVAVAPGAKVNNLAKEAGLSDEKTFRDNATGILREGGLDGEGTHHLEREGGPSQTVYLTSSVIDLDEFIDQKVQVWGETYTAQKAGWFMDVGKIKVLD
ncbi:hypothetical protein HY404_01410 [Candidatus Microgenomates bacterium]|nr:hypothetical protein [Candidatus Microgenomates bacterium]